MNTPNDAISQLDQLLWKPGYTNKNRPVTATIIFDEVMLPTIGNRTVRLMYKGEEVALMPREFVTNPKKFKYKQPKKSKKKIKK